MRENILSLVRSPASGAGEPQFDRFMNDLVAAAPDMIVACDRNFMILSGNAAATTWLGRRESAFLGRSIDDFLPGLSGDLRKQASGPFVLADRRGCRHNGASFPAEIRGYASHAEDGPRYLLFISNLAERMDEILPPLHAAQRGISGCDEIVLEKY
ncbi:MAG: PAS domain-containing protein [Oricola sp.]|jgi:PAS domain-containing protein|nr:PAS domain-containing protein [Oricola sp.]